MSLVRELIQKKNVQVVSNLDFFLMLLFPSLFLQIRIKGDTDHAG